MFDSRLGAVRAAFYLLEGFPFAGLWDSRRFHLGCECACSVNTAIPFGALFPSTRCVSCAQHKQRGEEALKLFGEGHIRAASSYDDIVTAKLLEKILPSTQQCLHSPPGSGLCENRPDVAA
jgi:hypothetical protein